MKSLVFRIDAHLYGFPDCNMVSRSRSYLVENMSPKELSHLLSRCALRDQEALQMLYRIAAPRLYAIALRLLKKTEWAEDVLQETFVRIWNHADRYRPDKSAPFTWMTTILRNKALDKLRELRRDPLNIAQVAGGDEAILQEESSAATPMDELRVHQEMGRLFHCLEELHDESRQAILMAYYHGYSHQELSRKLAKPLGTVKGWIRRGLESLRACLQGREL